MIYLRPVSMKEANMRQASVLAIYAGNGCICVETFTPYDAYIRVHFIYRSLLDVLVGRTLIDKIPKITAQFEAWARKENERVQVQERERKACQNAIDKRMSDHVSESHE